MFRVRSGLSPVFLISCVSPRSMSSKVPAFNGTVSPSPGLVPAEPCQGINHATSWSKRRGPHPLSEERQSAAGQGSRGRFTARGERQLGRLGVVVAQHDLEPMPEREVLVLHVVPSF